MNEVSFCIVLNWESDGESVRSATAGGNQGSVITYKHRSGSGSEFRLGCSNVASVKVDA